jgi:hypothetical protein
MAWSTGKLASQSSMTERWCGRDRGNGVSFGVLVVWGFEFFVFMFSPLVFLTYPFPLTCPFF